jgi:NADPH-dependent FMN reductase
MSKAFRLVGITGSLRKDSWNTKLLNAFAAAAREPEFVQQGVHFEIADWSKYLLHIYQLTDTDFLCITEIWKKMFLLQY